MLAVPYKDIDHLSQSLMSIKYSLLAAPPIAQAPPSLVFKV
jgi:hypothetical protein